MLDDVFIYPTAHAPAYTASLGASLDRSDPGFLVEVDSSQATRLLTHLKRHRLRARLQLRLLEAGEWAAWSVWRPGWTPHQHPDASAPDGDVGCVDSRAPGMGRRVVLPGGERPADVDVASLEAYTVRRMLQGVAEGAAEIVPETALPQESGIDYMGGVDFRKGCYVGQELTIRTHHTGVVRKRIMPLQLYALDDAAPTGLHYDAAAGASLLPPAGTAITRSASPPLGQGYSGAEERASGSSTGKFLAGVGNIGLALCRLEAMADLKLPGAVARRGTARYAAGDAFEALWRGEAGVVAGRVGVKAVVPAWWPSSASTSASPGVATQAVL